MASIVVGQRFRNWVVLKKGTPDSSRRIRWVCRCDCGTVREVKQQALIRGLSSSCGCGTAEQNMKRSLAGRKYPKMNAKDWARYREFLISRRNLYNVEEADIQGMMDRQIGCCAICKDSLYIPEDPSVIPHVDHCHTTGEVRGLLCSSCNLLLGKAKDDITILESAARYLRGI